MDRVTAWRNSTPVPGHYTNVPDRDVGSAVAEMGKLKARVRAHLMADGVTQPETNQDYAMFAEMLDRRAMLEPEQARLRALYRRMDNLYAPQQFTRGGADHWANEEPLVEGKVHISVNVHGAYVDVPASLQATPPVINYIPTGQTDEDRAAAARRERLLFEWWAQNEMDLKLHDTCRVRGLYGDAALKVAWNSVDKYPEVTVLESIENLYLGYGDSNFRRLDWALYCYTLSPDAVAQEWELSTELVRDGENYYPWVSGGADHTDPLGQINTSGVTSPERMRRLSQYEMAQVPVFDYWYKKPAGVGNAPEVWNCIYVGNYQAKAPTQHREYDDLPYIVISNSRVPGQANGKGELFDVEQILREKDERITQAAQMVHSTVQGQRWQLITSPDSPSEDEAPLPRPNQVYKPPPGGHIEAIAPWGGGGFAVEELLKRYDREAAVITGLNDLLLGLAPAQVLNSGKAISALTANYIARIGPKRLLLYAGLRRAWEMSAKVWERKDADVRAIIDGSYRVDIEPPDLTPRDELETASRAANLVGSKIWSLERAMDANGVEDPSGEKDLIREEQTDASLNPAAVQAMATLMQVFKQLGVQPPGNATDQAQSQDQSLNAARTLSGVPAGSPSMNQPADQGVAPPQALPANDPASLQAPGQLPAPAPGGLAPGDLQAQTMIQGGQASSRILTKQKL